ncbi:MAG: gas vesicle protein [Blastocatellia bacterium]|nr:gas vesicle protein [Blastocatellia bacterium]
MIRDVKNEVKEEAVQRGQPASTRSALQHQSLIDLETGRVSLCDLLDQILDKGALVAGELTISVADIDLLYLDLRLLLTSIAMVRREAMRRSKIELDER